MPYSSHKHRFYDIVLHQHFCFPLNSLFKAAHFGDDSKLLPKLRPHSSCSNVITTILAHTRDTTTYNGGQEARSIQLHLSQDIILHSLPQGWWVPVFKQKNHRQAVVLLCLLFTFNMWGQRHYQCRLETRLKRTASVELWTANKLKMRLVLGLCRFSAAATGIGTIE